MDTRFWLLGGSSVSAYTAILAAGAWLGSAATAAQLGEPLSLAKHALFLFIVAFYGALAFGLREAT